jgi:hypothetical protein
VSLRSFAPILTMTSGQRKPNPGETVVLTEIPSGFLDDLPTEDQQAVKEVLGKPILLKEYDDNGRAELEFTDASGVVHFIYVTRVRSALPNRNLPHHQ